MVGLHDMKRTCTFYKFFLQALVIFNYQLVIKNVQAFVKFVYNYKIHTFCVCVCVQVSVVYCKRIVWELYYLGTKHVFP